MNQQTSAPAKSRRSRGLMAVLSAVLMLSLLVVLHVGLQHLPRRMTQFDITGKSAVDLPADSEKFLSEMTQDVTVYWLCGEETEESPSSFKEWVGENLPVVQDIEDWMPLLLRDYAKASNRHVKPITLRDSEEISALLKDLGIEDLSDHSLIVKGDERMFVIDAYDLYTYHSPYLDENYFGTETALTWSEMGQMYQMFAAYGMDITQDGIFNHSVVAHARLTSALDYVTTDNMPHAYLLTGYRGTAMTETLQSYIGALNAGIEELDLGGITEIPADAGCVILYAPTEDITAEKAAMINAYLDQGGSLVLVTSPNTHVENCPNLTSLTKPFGLTALPGVLVDTKSGAYVSDTTTLVPSINTQHELYQLYQSGSYSLRMPWSHAIAIQKTTGAQAVGVFKTSASAIRREVGGEGATLGQAAEHNLAVEAYREGTVSTDGTAKTAHILWFASADAFTAETAAISNGNYYYMSYGTSLVSGGFLSSYEDIPGSPLATNALQETGEVIRLTVILVITAVIPLVLLSIGFGVWLYRRRRR